MMDDSADFKKLGNIDSSYDSKRNKNKDNKKMFNFEQKNSKTYSRLSRNSILSEKSKAGKQN